MQGVHVMHMRGSDSTIYWEVRLLYFSVCYCIYFLTEFGLKPAMGFCFPRLIVQPEYDVIVEYDTAQILSHIGPPNSS